MSNYNQTLQSNNTDLQAILTTINELPNAGGSSNPILQDKTVTPTTSKQEVTADSNYDGLNKVTVNAMPTATQATPSISLSSSGLITASATQSAGYVVAGTKSATKQLTVQAAQTITPGTSNKTIAPGRYLTGTQTIKGDANLVAGNIKSGTSIFGVTGTYAGSGGSSESTFPNGTSWVEVDVDNVVGPVLYHNGVWMCGHTNGVYYSIDDGLTWSHTNISGCCTCIKYNNGVWVAGSSTGAYYSTNGKVWTKFLDAYVDDIESDGRNTWLLSSSSDVYKSIDNGKTWDLANESINFYTIKYGNGIWVGVHSNRVYYSEDGMTWIMTNLPSNTISRAPIYDSGVWIMFINDYMYYSIDGKVWSCSNSPNGDYYTYFRYKDKLIAVDCTGDSIYSSTDNGKTWNLFSTCITAGINWMCYDNGIWLCGRSNTVALGSGVYYSFDGIVWHQSNISKNSLNFPPLYNNGVWIVPVNFALYRSVGWEPSIS